jgi:hypothetical protein
LVLDLLAVKEQASIQWLGHLRQARAAAPELEADPNIP